MKKVNIAELLKDCPRGMELDCTMFDYTTLHSVSIENDYPIKIVSKNGCTSRLTKYGQYINSEDAKCVIFPRGKNTWEGFHRPFIEGDIVSTQTGIYIGIVKSTEDSHHCDVFCSINDTGDFFIDKNLLFSRFATEEEKAKLFQAIEENGYRWNKETRTLEKLPEFKDGDILVVADTIYIYNGIEELSPYPTHYVYVIADKNGLFAINTSTKSYGARFATEEEKQKLFDAIKANGYQWNTETKTLEKLVEPKFKVGDRIQSKDFIEERTIKICEEDGYWTTVDTWIRISDQDDWELVPNKFDIATLKPFDKVLYRMHRNDTWLAGFYNVCIKNKFFVIGMGAAPYYIPYENNEHLLGTTNDCDDFYKTWEK